MSLPPPVSDLDRTMRLMTAGGAAGAVTKTSIAPLERLKVLAQTSGMRKDGMVGRGPFWPLHAWRDIVSKHGLKGLYFGNGANCLRIVPVYALKFSLNDTFKTWIIRSRSARGGPVTEVEFAIGGGEPLRKLELSFGEKIVVGSLAGVVQIIATYPLDLVRLRLQLAEHAGIRYRGIGDCLTTIAREESPLALYRGLLPSMAAGVPYVGLQMAFYDAISTEFGPRLGGGTQAALVCGSLAGISAQTLSFPMDTVRHRMQADGAGRSARVYASTLDCIQRIAREEGPWAFFRGWGINCFRALPGAAIQFASYDFFKRALAAGA